MDSQMHRKKTIAIAHASRLDATLIMAVESVPTLPCQRQGHPIIVVVLTAASLPSRADQKKDPKINPIATNV
eukprot:3020293-Pyramimonas_sp.AAC.1